MSHLILVRTTDVAPDMPNAHVPQIGEIIMVVAEVDLFLQVRHNTSEDIIHLTHYSISLRFC